MNPSEFTDIRKVRRVRRGADFRRTMASLARQVLGGSLSLRDLVDQAGGYDTGDNHVDEVLDLIEHEPARDGWLGIGKRPHDEYLAAIERLLKALETDD